MIYSDNNSGSDNGQLDGAIFSVIFFSQLDTDKLVSIQQQLTNQRAVSCHVTSSQPITELYCFHPALF